MPTIDQLLVIAATASELAPAAGWRTCVCGVGPIEAACATAAAIAAERPAAILHVGIAGARRRAGLAPGTLVLGRESRYCDLAPANAFSPRVLTPQAALLDAARRVLPASPTLVIGTSARVGGTADAECDVEAMEGFSVLRAAALAGVPALEVRAISNEIEEADRSRWQFELAFAAITEATPRLVAECLRCLS